MPWHISKGAGDCSGWAVVKDSDGKVVGCHPTKAKAQAQLAALNINAASKDLVLAEVETLAGLTPWEPMDERASVDTSSWDGNLAMTVCESASDYKAICAGRRAGDPELRSTWALPHHKRPGSPPNADGVRNALSRLPQTQGLTNKGEATRHLQAHMSSIQGEAEKAMGRDGVVRAIYPGVEVRYMRDDGAEIPTLYGHFARFNEWTEIDSVVEGHFMERIAEGAFIRSFDETTPKVLFQHGHDPHIGDKVLGIPTVLEEDDGGARYEVPLFDTEYNRELIPALRAGAYGASFRFRVDHEDVVKDPERSEHNPDGIPEKTIRAATVYEFGPVTFPAYAGATAGARSLTDEFSDFGSTLAAFANDKPGELAKRIENSLSTSRTVLGEVVATNTGPSTATVTFNPTRTFPPPNLGGDGSIPAGQGTEDKPLEDEASAPNTPKGETMDIDRFTTLDLLAERDQELAKRAELLNAEYSGAQFPEEVQTEWDELVEEREAIAERQEHLRERENYLAGLVKQERHVERPVQRTTTTNIRKGPENPYDLAGYRAAASSPEQERRMLMDGVMRSIEGTAFAHPEANHEDSQAAVERTTKTLDREGDLARYMLSVGSEVFHRAFWKFAQQRPMTPEEANALDTARQMQERAFTLGSTGLPVPYQLDPTIIPISNLSVNPYRAISRVVQTTVNEWQAATSAGITAAYATEGTEAGDNTPTLARPSITAQRAQAFVPFSIEVSQDWGAVEAEMAREFQDAKDDLEATKFTLGTGTNEPQGIITGATTTVTAGGTAAFAAADVYATESALPPRFRPRAVWIGNRATYNRVRQFDTAGGAQMWTRIGEGLANQVPTPGNTGYELLGYPANESSAMDAVLTTGSEILVLGDFRHYVIVDRVGMSVDLLPHLVGTSHRPTGQRGVYAFWRNGAKVLAAGAFRTLTTG